MLDKNLHKFIFQSFCKILENIFAKKYLIFSLLIIFILLAIGINFLSKNYLLKSGNEKLSAVINSFIGKKHIDLYIQQIPKAELHLHIEGTLEPEMLFDLAKKNHVKINYNSINELKKAYNFDNLQSFLDLYYVGMKVLQTEQDFYDLTLAYLKKAHAQNVWHIEIFFDPQGHTSRGVKFSTVINGISHALKDGEKQFGITSNLILCFLRHLSEEDAMQTLEEALPYKGLIKAVGLDSSEIGNPPSKFKHVFAKARSLGFLTVAHAGEEGPPAYIWDALKSLRVSRIDHGNHAIDDEALIQKLVEDQIPLTMCPLSNYKLKAVKDPSKHPLKRMLGKGVLVTINSDDPAYFGHLNNSYFLAQKGLNLTEREIYILAENSFKASFIEPEKKKIILEKLLNFKPKN